MNDSLQSVQGLVQQNIKGEITSSLLDLFLVESFIVIIIWVFMLLLFIACLYIFFERYLILSQTKLKSTSLLKDLQDSIYNGKIDSAIELCKKSNTIEGSALLKGVQKIGKPTKEIHDSIMESFKLEFFYLEKNSLILNYISKIAPILGLLGTIVNIITSYFFYKNIILETIIIQSLFSSAIGLALGLLSYLFYCILTLRLKIIWQNMKISNSQFLDILNRPIV